MMESPKFYEYPINPTIIYDRKITPLFVSGAFTPVGSFLGKLSKVPAPCLNDAVIKAALQRANVRFGETKVVDEDQDKVHAIITGNIIGPEHDLGRLSAYRLGFEHVAGERVEKMCISGLKAINDALLLLTHPGSPYQRVVASGVENMSRVPHHAQIRGKALQHKKGAPKSRRTFYGHITIDPELPLLDSLEMRDALMDALTCDLSGLIMGKTAEKLAAYFKITKREADTFAEQSHLNAGAAGLLSIYDDILRPISGLIYHEGIKTDKIFLDGIHDNTRFVFRDDRITSPVITPDNACPLNDGSAAVYMVHQDIAKTDYRDPAMCLGYALAYTAVAVDPSIMGIGPSPAIHLLTERTQEALGIGMDDIAIVNVNEAFSAQVLAVQKDLKDRYNKDISGKLNRDGGSIAIGHPVGSTLVRMVIETFQMLKERNLQYGIASACVGHGMGGALLLENPSYIKSRPSITEPAIERIESQTGENRYNLLRRLMVYGTTPQSVHATSCC